MGEFGDESGEKKTQGQRVLDLLRKFSPKGLEACEISTYLSIERKTLYTVLDRLEDRQMITKRRSITDSRRWVYAVAKHTTNSNCTTEIPYSTSGYSPPPPFISGEVELTTVTQAVDRLQDSQQIVNKGKMLIASKLAKMLIR